MLKSILPVLLIFLSVINGYAEQPGQKREKIRNAISKGILSLYDVPFNTYIRFRMWEEIEQILKANAKDAISHQLPSPYYSRPYIVNRQAWVFENSAVPGGSVYVMTPDKTNLIKREKNKDYAQYEGGVRAAFGSTVISGGSDKDVDTAVLWDTKTEKVRTVRLKDGHYISAIAVTDNMLYIGSCGGKINAYRYDNLAFSKVYSTSPKENINWEVFNQKECITSIGFSEGKLIGAGDKTVFVWTHGAEIPVKTYPKTFINSVVSFYKHYMIEHKSDDVAIRDLMTHKTRKLKAQRAVEDAVITDEKILKQQSGDILILALKRDAGLSVYDLKTLLLTEQIELTGHKIAASGRCIFATDDSFFYRYYLPDREPEKFKMFLKTFHPENITPNEETYYRLLKLARDYPDIVKPYPLAQKFLEQHHLDVRYLFKYGKIGENITDGKQEEIFGYKLFYEVSNRSDKRYLITMDFTWSGYYGQEHGESGRASSKQSFMIDAHAEYRENFVVGDKEPMQVLFYPTEIIALSEEDYEGLNAALSMENQDIAIIDLYLAKQLPSVWQKRLVEKKLDLLKKRIRIEGFYKD